MKNKKSFTGCLVGGACGDALGYEVEFEKMKGIKRKFGIHGITDFNLNDGVALISDDTQMTLFTAAGLLAGSNSEIYIKSIWASYKDWYQTQIVDPVYKPYTELYRIKALHSRRAPGNTCLTSLRLSENGGSIESPINMSKGCGGIMRVAPIGLLDISDEPYINGMLGAEAAALTHGHPLGYIPAGCMADIIHRIVFGEEKPLLLNITDSVSATVSVFKDIPSINEFQDLMMKAVFLSGYDMDDTDAIRQLGEGWIAGETLAIAIYSCLKYGDDFKKAIICAVNHDGDSDSTGSVAGNILGSYMGIDIVNESFRTSCLELYELIIGYAEALYDKK